MITKKDFILLTEHKNFKLLDNHEYVGGSIKYPIVCHCGNTWNITYTNLKTVKACPKCKGQSLKKRMEEGTQTNNKMTTDEFKIRLKEKRSDVTLVEGEVYQGASKKVLVRCSNGHTWPVRPHHIISGSRCPECNKRTYDNSLIDSKLIGDFKNITRLSDCTPGESVQFYCNEGHDFWIKPAQLFNTKSRAKCPICSRKHNHRGFRVEEISWLYFATVVVNNTILYKVGITNRPPKIRVAESFKKFHVYKEIKLDGKYVANIERYIKQKLKPYRAFQNGSKVDCESGHTEVYKEEPMQFFTKEEITAVALGKTFSQPR